MASCLASCFKDEPKNAECDITRAVLPVEHPEDYFNPTIVVDTIINAPGDTSFVENTVYTDSVADINGDYANPDITFYRKREADATALAPRFTLTPGATIVPESGSAHDFSGGPVAYTVTSEDGQWQRTYQVYVRPYPIMTLSYGFENYELAANDAKKYYTWYDLGDDGSKQENWATGNAGFKKAKGMSRANEYPTIPLAEGYKGSGVQLTTRETGSLGRSQGMPIAAGNLFLGSFNALDAFNDALSATKFGIPFNKKLLKFRGYYKYKPGERYILKWDKGSTTPEYDDSRTDEATIYAVLYKNHDADGNAVTLNGSNVQSSPLLVARAILPSVPPTDEWTHFEIDFSYSDTLDTQRLEDRGYSIAIVCSSSIDGAYFRGAVGSTLCVDELELVCEEQEDKQ